MSQSVYASQSEQIGRVYMSEFVQGESAVQHNRCKIALITRTIGAERGRAARGAPDV